MARNKLTEGLYDLPISAELTAELRDSDWHQIQGELDAVEGSVRLAQYLQPLIRVALEEAGKRSPESQTVLVNRLIEVLTEHAPKSGVVPGDYLVDPLKRLLELQTPRTDLGQHLATDRPGIPLTESDLLVNGPQEMRMGSELRKELMSADRVDLLCAFLRMSGLNRILDPLETFMQRSGKLRVITTTYMGATEKRALDALVARGADVKVSYNNQTTRLHAKAWMFHRESGFSTCYVGSSNLSHAALFDGLEWNVRVSNTDNPHILRRFETTFDQYWADNDFESYQTERDGERFQAAIKQHVREQNNTLLTAIDVRPYPHQQQILDELAAVRENGQTRNLVVAATGTGKTVVAALDYKRLCDQAGRHLKLLFVAHRKEILEQSQATFRAVMRDASFGERLTGDLKPESGEHVFASVFSLHEDRMQTMAPDAYEVVIVDEFHHAKAPTYERLLDYIEPTYLLGLSATPERTDGKSVLGWFGGKITSEIRLWDALDRGLLSPFQYFGVADTTDLSSVEFTRGRYEPGQLEDVITGDTMRARRIFDAVDRYTSDPNTMRAIGFCVGLKHAAQMADAFNQAGLPSCAVAGSPPMAGGVVQAPFMDRKEAIQQLNAGKLRCVFSVDLFNEGVDIPKIDTVLFLRPTSSSIVFLQQLGRGLRHAEGKSHLTVLDFIGNANKKYRYDTKFRAILGGTTPQITDEIEQGFPRLPPGCDIVLEKQAQDYVVKNIKQSVTANVTQYAKELQSLVASQGDVDLDAYLDAMDIRLQEFYSQRGRSWTDIRRRAGLAWPESLDGEDGYLRAIAGLAHVDDWQRLTAWKELLGHEEAPAAADLETKEGRLQLMFLAAIADRTQVLDQMHTALQLLWQHQSVRSELGSLFAAQSERMRNLTTDLGIAGVPLRVHGTYSLAEIMAGFGIVKKGALYAPREGVLWDPVTQTDLFFITLNKSESDYSPQTLYQDYPISLRQFHWESQHSTRSDSPTGQRYIDHQARGSNVLLFVRQHKKVRGLTQPYLCLGKARYVSHVSERPMQIVWELDTPMPPQFYQLAKTAAG